MATLYGFKQQIDTNPNSPTWNDTQWVRDVTGDSACAELTTPDWKDTGNKNCSTSATTYTPSSKGTFGWKEQRDDNPLSDTHNDTQWVRDASYDGTCQSAVAPTWEDTDEVGCSTSETEYIPV